MSIDWGLAQPMPNYFAQFAQARALGEQRRDQNALRQLAPAALGGDQQALEQVMALDPQRGKQYADAGEDKARKLRGAALYVKRAADSGDPAAVQAAYTTVSPFFERVSGKPLPPFDPSHLQGIEQILAQTEYLDTSKAEGAPAQQRYLEWLASKVPEAERGDVFRVAAGTDPRATARLYEGAGGAYGVTMGGGRAPTAAPITVGGTAAPAPTGPAPGAPANMPTMQLASTFQSFGGKLTSGYRDPAKNAAVDGVPNSQHMRGTGMDFVFPSPQIKAQAIATARAQGYEAIDEGDHVHFELPPSGAAGPQQLQPAPAKENPYEAERLQLARNADARAEAAANKPPTLSAAERKDMLARRAKIPQLQNTVRGMNRIEQALGKIEGSFVDTGPADQYATRLTKAGQELEAAVGAIQNSMLSLTRVPGIGSQSDLEARIAGLAYPSLDKAPEVNARTLEQLKAFVTDLAQAYQVAAEMDREVAAGAAPKAAAAANGGWSIRAVE